MHAAIPRNARDFFEALELYNLQPYRLTQKFVLCKFRTDNDADTVRGVLGIALQSRAIVSKHGGPFTKFKDDKNWWVLIGYKATAFLDNKLTSFYKGPL